MTRTLTTLAVAVALIAGTASANTYLSVVDTGVDYTDTDLEAAYLAFSYDGDVLAIAIDDDTGSGLPAIAFYVPDLGRTDLFGDEYGARLSDIDDVTVESQGGAVVAFGVRHESADIDDVADAYTSALEAEGLTVRVEKDVNANVVTLVTSGADGQLVVKLHRIGGDVSAYLWTA
jgi:hypothetical protein